MALETLTFEAVVKSMDETFDATGELHGAVRMLAALAEKSVTARDTLLALPGAVATALKEVGLEAAADEVASDSAILEVAEVAEVADENEDEGEGDDEDAEEADGAIEELGKSVKGVAAMVGALSSRLDALEARKGVSQSRGWGDGNVMPATKSGDGLWTDSAFDGLA